MSDRAAATAAGTDARPLKLCFVGEPGVGKSSLAQRLVHARFPAAPTGPGIRVEAHRLALADGDDVALTVWDLAAASAVDTLNQAYLSGIDAVVGVALAGDPASAERTLGLLAQVRRLHPRVEAALFCNKADLVDGTAALPALPVPASAVSARDGSGVVDAVADLVRRVARRP